MRRPPLARTVVALGVVSLLTDVSSEMIYPLLPVFLTATLGASVALVGAIEGAAETTASLLKLASGWWSDRLRRRKPLVLAGYALSSAVRPLVALAGSAGQVLVVRLADRVGKGVRSSPRDALIADAVPATERGRAFGFHRAMDHAGAVAGPLVAFALLRYGDVSLRDVFLLAAVPGILAVAILAVGVREAPRALPALVEPSPAAASPVIRLSDPLPARFWRLLAVLLLFTLGNSTDAFLLLRAGELGVPVTMLPILWALLHVVKSAASTPGGALSDRIGRRPVIVAGWLVYAVVYAGFAYASESWQAWALFVAYGTYFGLVEGTEKALVADLVPAARRGTAFGWYNLTIGVAALPASLLFGWVWTRHGAPAAFGMGAALAAVAAVAILVVTRPPDADGAAPARDGAPADA